MGSRRKLSALEAGMRDLQNQRALFREGAREARAERQELKGLQSAWRVCRRRSETCKRHVVKRTRALIVARKAALKLKKNRLRLGVSNNCGKVPGLARVEHAKEALDNARDDRVEADRKLRTASAEKRASIISASRAVAKKGKLKNSLKVISLRLRQQRALHRNQKSHARGLAILEKKHAAKSSALAAKHQEEIRDMEKQAREELRSFRARGAVTMKTKREKQKASISAFSRRLRTDEPRHADKFKKACIVKRKGYSNECPLYVLNPKGQKHQYTLVYCHQFNCTADGYADWRPHYFFSASRLPSLGLRITIPTAKVLKITGHGGEEKHAWYDYLIDWDGVREDPLRKSTLWDSRNRIFKILDQEVEALGGDASRVFLGGASQGCCLSLHCALTYPRVLGGYVGNIGHLLSCTPVPASKRNLPIYMYNGLEDHNMRWPWVRKTYRRFEKAGYTNVHLHREPGVGHNCGSKEREWIVDFLQRVMKARDQK